MPRRISVDITAALPGVVSASSVSSLTVTRLSQPQKMKMPISSPAVSAPIDPTANGLNHDSDGWIDPRIPWPVKTRPSATTAKTARVAISAVSSQRCVRALTSMPITQMKVITAIQAIPIAVTATTDGCETPNRRNVYSPAICARLAMTMTSATMIAQPPIHPDTGPNARVAHENVVPASGSAWLRYL